MSHLLLLICSDSEIIFTRLFWFLPPPPVSLQKLRNFHSLSCPGITSDDPLKSGPAALSLRPNADDLSDNEDGPELNGNESSDTDWNPSGRGDNTMAGTTGGKDGETLWVGLCSMTRDMYQLGGELDIEQIERNWAELLFSPLAGEANHGTGSLSPGGTINSADSLKDKAKGELMQRAFQGFFFFFLKRDWAGVLCFKCPCLGTLCC